MLLPEVVDEPQQCAEQVQGDLTAVSWQASVLMDHVMDVVVERSLTGLEVKLEIAQVSIESPRDAVADGELKEVVAHGDAEGLDVGRSLSILYDAIGAQVQEVACRDVVVNHVERHASRATRDEQDAHLGQQGGRA